jgi:antitoxin component of MazEF toxin-antitoxin module
MEGEAAMDSGERAGKRASFKFVSEIVGSLAPNESRKLCLRAEAAQCFYPIRFGKIDVALVLPDHKCMKTTLSAKRQVSIPKQLCDELELEPGAQIAWEVQDSKLVGRPLPKEGWRSLIGKYKGGPDLVAALLKQRREDREREDRKLAR